MVFVSSELSFVLFSSSFLSDVSVFLQAKGIYMFDKDGKRYMDFNSQLMCTNLGHGDERVNQAILKQLQKALSYFESFSFPFLLLSSISSFLGCLCGPHCFDHCFSRRGWSLDQGGCPQEPQQGPIYSLTAFHLFFF